MKAITSYGFVLIAMLIFLLSIVPCAAQVPAPIFRLFDHKSGIHFYTADENRKLEAIGAGWTYEGVAAYGLDQQTSDWTPLYVFVLPLRFGEKDKQFIGNVFNYVTSESEKLQLLQSPATPYGEGGVAASHWAFDASGITGYVASKPVPGTVPLYKLYHPPVFTDSFAKGARDCLFNCNDVLLTTSVDEKAAHLAQHGYKFVNIVGYVWPQAPTVAFKHTPKIPLDTAGKKTFNPDTDLLNRGCTRSAVGVYNCSSVAGYEACEIYRKQGKANACSTTANLKVQAAMEKLLFSLGCSRFLARPDEFICKTQKSYDLCETYVQNGHAKRCLLTKQ